MAYSLLAVAINHIALKLDSKGKDTSRLAQGSDDNSRRNGAKDGLDTPVLRDYTEWHDRLRCVIVNGGTKCTCLEDKMAKTSSKGWHSESGVFLNIC